MIDLESLSLQELLDIREKIDEVINRKKERIMKENSYQYSDFNDEKDFFEAVLRENHTSLDDNEDYWKVR